MTTDNPSSAATDIPRLIRELAKAENALQEALEGDLDAVLDPETGAPLLLRRAQAALSESSARYSRLIERMSALIFELEPDGTIAFANPALSRLTGYEEAELKGANFWTLLKDDEAPDSTRFLKEALEAGDVSNRPCFMKTRQGDSVCIEVTTANRYAPGGRLERVIAFALDVTERNHAERALRWMNSVVNASDDAILATTPEGVITTWSPGARGVFGYEAAEAVGQHLSLLEPEDRRGEFQEVLARLSEGKRVRTFESEGRHKSGRRVSISVNMSSIRDEHGELMGIACVYSDVSDYRKLQEEFRQAQKMEAVGRLAGGVAHDFNNLLSVILGYSEILSGEFEGADPKREVIDEIRRAGERAAALTRQLLAFSRKQVLVPKNIDLNDLIGDFEKMLRRIIGEDIELAFQQKSDLWKIRVDPFQIEQVLMNTVLNARDAMPDGGVITISLDNVTFDEAYVAEHPYVIPGDYVGISISDTGSGMSTETRSRLFEPFFTTKGVSKGTGLGLSTVYGIMKQSGGYVEVESELGKGSVFHYYLPRVAEESTEATPEEQARTGRGGNETILLVEDEAGLRRLAARVLRDAGYVVLEAEDGPQALALAASHSAGIDLLLTDVVMPGMNGRALALQIETLRPGIAVMYASGYPDEVIAKHGVLEPGTVFLHKPYTSERMLNQVRSALDQHETKP